MLHPKPCSNSSSNRSGTGKLWRVALTNAEIADRLEALASLLDLSGSSPYAPRAYRRAAETIRETQAPIPELVRTGRVRDLRGIGPGIEARLQELVETGQIAELDELEGEVSAELVALGRMLGFGPQLAVEIGQSLGIRTVDEFRAAAAEGQLGQVRGIGPKTEAKLLAALVRGERPRPRRGLLLNQARALSEGVAEAVGGEVAGDPRRWRDSSEVLAVVCSASEPRPVLARFERLPQIVSVVERSGRQAIGVTVEGVPIELVVAEPERFGTELVRATGSAAYVEALEPLPDGPDEESVYRALGVPFCPPELREAPFRGDPPKLVELGDVRGDLHVHTDWSDGRATVLEMARPRAGWGTTTWRSATTRGTCASCRGWMRTTCAAKARRSLPPMSGWRRSGSCAGSNATSCPTGRSTSPTTCWLSSSGCRRACMPASGRLAKRSRNGRSRRSGTRRYAAAAIRRVG